MGYSIQLELEQIFPVPFQLWVLSNHWFDLFFVEELDQVMVLESLMLSWNHRASKAISMAAYFAIPIDLPSSSLLVKDPFGYSDVVDNIMVVVTKAIYFVSNIDVADPCYLFSRSLMQALTSDSFDLASLESLQVHWLTWAPSKMHLFKVCSTFIIFRSNLKWKNIYFLLDLV